MNVSCSISGACGGCSAIDVPYERQLHSKQQRIAELLGPLACDSCILPILGMDDPQRYRTKIVSPFAPAKSKRSLRSMARTGKGGRIAVRQADILTGLYAAGTHRIVACDDCPVEHEAGRRVVGAVRQIMARYGMQPYDEDAHTGFVRHVVVRVGQQSGEVLVTIVTNAREFTGARNFCRELVRRVPQVTTIVQNVNTSTTNAILGHEEHVLFGPGFILDTLCGLSFRISSHSFYQVNAVQTEVLYRTAVDLAFEGCRQTAAPTILDAYCGTGTIGLVAAAANPAARVIGVDNIEAAISDARQNAAHNGIANATFSARDAGSFMREFAASGQGIDVLFLDPPRSGASKEFLRSTLACSPARIVYISCNPATLERDAASLCEGGYRIGTVQPVDMFPHTDYIECVVAFSKE